MPPSPVPLPVTRTVRPNARIRTSLQDFEVIERLEPGEPLPGKPLEGAHLWLRIRKTGISTPAAARLIASHLRIDVRDIGYSGLKDEMSVAEQWFSIPAASGGITPFPASPCLEVVEQRLQPRKLRRGTHAGNDFRLVLREIETPLDIPPEWRFANYFGARRFGVDNIETAIDWILHRRQRRISRFKEGIYLSVLRALLFNEVLSARVLAGSHESILPGDVADHRGFPTGPLWGRGRSATGDEALAIEQGALGWRREVCEALEYAGVQQDRRSLVGIAAGVSADWRDASTLVLAFSLPAGSYATVALGELFTVTDPADR